MQGTVLYSRPTHRPVSRYRTRCPVPATQGPGAQPTRPSAFRSPGTPSPPSARQLNMAPPAVPEFTT